MVRLGEGRDIVEVGSAVGGLGKRAGRGRLGSYATVLEAEMRECLQHRPVSSCETLPAASRWDSGMVKAGAHVGSRRECVYMHRQGCGRWLRRCRCLEASLLKFWQGHCWSSLCFCVERRGCGAHCWSIRDCRGCCCWLVVVAIVVVVVDPAVADLAVAVTVVVTLGVLGCVALEVAVVVPRAVVAHPLLPLPKGVPIVVENVHGWV